MSEENHVGLSKRVKGFLFEDESPTQEASSQEIPKKTVPISTTVTTLSPQTISGDDRGNAIRVLSERVFAGDTPYMEYRSTYDALADAVPDEGARRKAALAVVVRKHGADGLAVAIAQCKEKLVAEQSAFEKSIGPGQGPIDAFEREIAVKDQDISKKEAEIAQLEQDIKKLKQDKEALQGEAAKERAKQEHARAVFEIAHQALSQELAADEKLFNQP